jgi:hypothetical protein
MAQKEVTKRPKLDLEKERKRMREKVQGIFHFHEVPGGGIEFNYKEFDGDPIEKFSMLDGYQYTVPYGVARHLNRNGWYPEYGHVQVDAGPNVRMAPVGVNNTEARIVRKVRRYSFSSLEFLDLDDFPTADKQILQVQTV